MHTALFSFVVFVFTGDITVIIHVYSTIKYVKVYVFPA